MAFSDDVIKGFLEHQVGSGGILSQERARREKQQQTRLELTLLSRKMEMEFEKHKAETQFDDRVKRFSPEGSQYIAKELGLPIQPGQQFRDTEGSTLAGMANTANRIENSQNIRHGSINSVIRTVDNIVYEYPRMKDGSLGPRKMLGYSPQASKEVREAVSGAIAAREILGQARSIMQKTAYSVDDSTVISRVFNGLKLKYQNLVGTNPEAAVLIQGLESFGSALARGTGESGVLSRQDVEARIKTLPSPFNSAESSEALLAMMENLVDSIEDGKVSAFTKPMGDILEDVQKRRDKRNGKNLRSEGPLPADDPKRQAIQQLIIQKAAEIEKRNRGE